MTTPEEEVDLLRREYLDSPDAEFLRRDLVLAVAERIVKYEDPALLKQMPGWVGDMVREMCDEYRRHGGYGVMYSVGYADYTEMVARLTELLGSD